MNLGYVLLATVLIPIAVAVVLVFVPSRLDNVVRVIAVVTGAVLFALSLWVFFGYQVGGNGGFQGEIRWQWIHDVAHLGSQGVTLHLGVDGIGAAMVLLNGVVTVAACIVSTKIAHRNKDFFILLFLLIAGVYGTFVSLDLFFFFLFYELAVLPMYLLIAVWGSSSTFRTFARTKEYGAMKLTIMLVAASVLIWIGIFAVYNEAGLGTFDLPALYSAQLSVEFQRLFFPFMVIGCGILAGLWPFHTWSPDGHVAAPTAVSMLHAGVLMKLGAFGIIRLGIQLLPEGAEFWMPGLLVLGTVGALYGAVSALSQGDLKYVIGYSSVSHMGYVMMGLATLNVIGLNGAVLQMFSHGVMTALLFAMVGSLYDQAHTREIRIFGGVLQRMPRFVIFFTLAGFASLGLPGLSGFVAEFNIFVGLFRDYPVFGALGILAAAVTATYILRLLGTAMFGPFNERWAFLHDATPKEQLAGVILAGFILFMGLWPSPFVERIRESLLAMPGVAR
jgi:NADH-quinone oxidoreductase subunit M